MTTATEWTPEAARERLAQAEQHRVYLDEHPADLFGSGAAWAQRERPRMDAYRAEKDYLYRVARADLTAALDRIAALESLLAARERGVAEQAAWGLAMETERNQVQRMYDVLSAEVARLRAALAELRDAWDAVQRDRVSGHMRPSEAVRVRLTKAIEACAALYSETKPEGE